MSIQTNKPITVKISHQIGFFKLEVDDSDLHAFESIVIRGSESLGIKIHFDDQNN